MNVYASRAMEFLPWIEFIFLPISLENIRKPLRDTLNYIYYVSFLYKTSRYHEILKIPLNIEAEKYFLNIYYSEHLKWNRKMCFGVLCNRKICRKKRGKYLTPERVFSDLNFVLFSHLFLERIIMIIITDGI